MARTKRICRDPGCQASRPERREYGLIREAGGERSAQGEMRSRTEPVKDMPAQRMTVRQRRIVEIVDRIAAHPEPFHDGARAVVRRGCERYDLGEREGPEAVVERQSRRLGCVTASPMREGEAPADFHTGHEMSGESRNRQSSEADERGHPRD